MSCLKLILALVPLSTLACVDSDASPADGGPSPALRYDLGSRQKLVAASKAPRRLSSITHHGITWKFDKEYPAGQFISGDWYVVGPVRIVATEPGWDGQCHGSMINPSYGGGHGYDRRFCFQESLRAEFPRTVPPDSSVVSAVSWRGDEPGSPEKVKNAKLRIPRPALRRAAVLTVLRGVPAKAAFRPPYAGDLKPLYFRDELRPEILPKLEPVASAPTISSLLPQFEHVWLDHLENWQSAYLCPSENMPHYGREIAQAYNDATLALLLDYPTETKLPLIERLVQIGIDDYGVVATGAEWGLAGGGLGSGRKWPILFAGLLLDAPALMNAGKDFPAATWQEDCQTFYLSEEEASKYPGVRPGTPVWGARHCGDPGRDPGNTAYQWCCTANGWAGAVLAARILDAKELWAHDPLFDYQDWYMEHMRGQEWKRGSDFAAGMWDRYRSRFGSVWSPETLDSPGAGGG